MAGWQRSRIIPVSGIANEKEAEQRATSALLAVLSIVRPFSQALLTQFGASRAEKRCCGLWSCAAVIVLLASSCVQTDPQESQQPADAAVAVLRCPNRIDTVSAVSNPIGDFAGLASIEANQLGPRTVDRDTLPPLRFAKIALIIRNGRSFSVRIGRSVRANGGDQDALIEWSNLLPDGALVQEIQVKDCYSYQPGWSVYSGGVWIEEPGCVELIFSPDVASLVQDSDSNVPSSEISVQVSIGAPCP